MKEAFFRPVLAGKRDNFLVSGAYQPESERGGGRDGRTPPPTRSRTGLVVDENDEVDNVMGLREQSSSYHSLEPKTPTR